MVFWLLIGALTLATILVLARQMLRLRDTATSNDDDTSKLSSDMKVYRDQLSELDRDVARGTVTAQDAERARIEISRRLLEADKAAQAKTRPTDAPRTLSRLALGLCAILLAGGAFGLYWLLGSPGFQDLGREKRIAKSQEMRESRPSQAEVEADMPPWPGPPAEAPADYLELIEGLRDAVTKNPDDPHGLDLLVQHEAAIGNMVAAHKAMGHLIEVKGAAATADDFVRQADLLVNAAGGFISPEAEDMLRKALERDPNHQLARYYSGLMFAQNGRPDMGFNLWRGLLEEGPDTAIWWSSVRSQIGSLATFAGVDYTPPDAPTRPAVPNLTGPSADDIEAAQEMSGEDRAAMIQGMIDRLSERLATEGGTPEEWARLINVLGVVGNTGRASTIWDEAQTLFQNNPDALATVRIAAEQAGVAP
ncbi:cytochrome c-type biogenesis protein CcmH [Aliiroseovarius sediminilitoris]|uniref:Cytochrome c-type biogenesis protein CcmH n=1 Tax=Aliiroseovarius sediminilitoris TaxID=1173584 RepID=A0A1I0Q3P4_9RHOB|nr:c-type cytochrome biogenesis protein CcmI [Aliiroseovarius sediminilitoris]SEW21414.1 cytochrome c-type biogenesis protein CcmH [Aliiroseovarius sediminilitoris]